MPVAPPKTVPEVVACMPMQKTKAAGACKILAEVSTEICGERSEFLSCWARKRMCLHRHGHNNRNLCKIIKNKKERDPQAKYPVLSKLGQKEKEEVYVYPFFTKERTHLACCWPCHLSETLDDGEDFIDSRCCVLSPVCVWTNFRSQSPKLQI